MFDIIAANSLLFILLIISISVIFLQDLLKIIVVMSLFSILCMIYYTLNSAVDVALTESAVGIVASSAMMILTVQITTRQEIIKYNKVTSNITIFILLSMGALLCYSIFLSPMLYGDIDNAINNDIVKLYMHDSYAKYDIPNFVTTILASFRGFDTMGETMVIFTAALSVYSIFRSNHE